MDQSLHHPGRTLLVALGLGVCADWLFYDRWLGLSAPLFVLLCLLALAGLSMNEERLPRLANLWPGAAALFFAGCLALRDEPLLSALNLVAVLALLLLVAHYQVQSLPRVPIGRVLERSLYAMGAMSFRPVSLTTRGMRSLPVGTTQVYRLAPVARGVLLALPIFLVFGGLLMAADSVFASYVLDLGRFNIPFDAGSALLHELSVCFFAYVCAGGLQVALLDNLPTLASLEAPPALPSEGDTQRLEAARSWRFLGFTEAFTVLTLVDLLFAGFVLVQAAYLFGGMNTLDRTGMTYADYARRGFFELLLVAGLSLGLVLLMALFTKRAERTQLRLFNGASVALVVLVVGILASAFQRMLLYEQAYGFTRLRLYTHSFMIWLAVVLVVCLVAVLRNRLWLFVSGSLATALVYLALLNVINPDALIVRENVARFQQTGSIDAYYLAGLSSDALPVIAASLGQLDDASRAEFAQMLPDRLAELERGDAYGGWPSWHAARSAAIHALRPLYSGK